MFSTTTVFPLLKENGIVAYDDELPIYKYLTIEGAKLLLAKGTLKYSSALEFNDPFELHEAFLKARKPTSKEAKDYMDEMYADLPRRERRRQQQALATGGYNKSIPRVVETQKEKLGICCFSKTNMETLMWSHYAEKHKGICLGFRIPNLNNSNTLFMNFCVKYAHNIRPMNFVTSGQDNRMLAICNWIFTKSFRWEYEREVRIVNLQRSGLVGFDKRWLTEVYFGVATPPGDVEEIKKLLKASSYEIEKAGHMGINTDTFDLALKL